jgi:hypothetical protein
MRSALGRLAFALLVVLGIEAAAEASPSRVVVVRAADASKLVGEATTRLRAELTASGFEVIMVEKSPLLSPREAVEDADLRPVAALSIVSTDRGAAIDVWVADHLTGKTLVRRIDVEPEVESEAPKILAVRAAELLRASLLEAAHPPEETKVAELPADVARWVKSPSAAPAPPDRRAGPRPPAPPPRPAFGASLDERAEDAGFLERSSFGLGAAALYHFDANPPSFGPDVRLSYRFAPRWAFALSVIGPAFGLPIERAAGSLAVREGLAAGEVFYAILPRGRLTPSLSLGAGAHLAYIEGSAQPPHVARTADVVSFLASAGASIEIILASRVSLHAGARALFMLPGALLRIDGAEVGRIGRVNLAGSLGVAVSP